MAKLIPVFLVFGFVVLYLIGIKRFWTRLTALLILLLSLGIIIPNLTVDEAGFIVRDVTHFTEHIAGLLRRGDAATAEATLVEFNGQFSRIARDMTARPEFIGNLIENTNVLKQTRDSEQHGGRISSEGAPSAPPNESSP
jgi:hypothetical protein